ncbi:hypothetical protein MNBD_GAMMA01-1912 [hydrothermal vent metagenome]|uniref:P/Homo B domain-containing protein n=1 Tax=hydrothermal vent metagenome TaxID=652676 RepID=A0A3B0VXU5_9ZZZZ
MNKIIIVMILLTNLATARMGSEPPSQRYNILTKQEMQLYTLKPVDVPLLLQKNIPKDYDPKPVTFAVGNSTDINLKSHGSWTDVPGGQIWNLRFESKNATDINFGFTKFNLPVGVELYLISFADDPVYYDGPYTSEDNQSYKQFWSAPLPGGDVALELFVPNGVTEQIELGLTKVSTGFRDVFKRYNGDGLIPKQGACNNDVVCPEGDLWRDEIRSVAAYTMGGTDTCTGTMVMDANRSFTPYFLTADHCGVRAANAATMVTIWNYESANCGDLSGGLRLDTVSGVTFRATRSDVDFTLVELSSMPPDAFEVYWAGWDSSGATPAGSVGIHHPGVDEKAISFNTDPLTTINSCIGGGTNTHWEVDNWEDGTTEPGSSGSGLWDPDTHFLVGFLSGGSASCSSITMDCYGKVSEAWDDGSGVASNLKTWLDPSNTGVTSVAGSDPNPFSLTSNDMTIEVCSGDNGAGSTVNVVTNGVFNGAVALAATTAPAFITGFNFGTNPIDPTPGSSTFIFNVGAGGTTGDNALVIQGSGNDNGTPITADVSINLLYSAGPTAATTLATPADGAVDVALSTTFSWAADANATSYHLMVSDDPGFGTLLISEFVTDTNFDAVGLPGATQLYWKVATISSCGPSHVESSVFTFTTEEVFCVSTPNAIPDNSPGAGVDITLPVTVTGSLASLTASVKSDHTWPGDLIFTLSHAGTSVVLMDRPGVPTTTFGCGQDGVDAVFDDASATPVETECAAASPGIGGTLAPEQPLSAFAGAEFSGNWVLNVTDNAALDTGNITEFCVVPAMLSDLIFANGFE